MASVLFAWELGSGLGHLTSIRPLADALVAAGHRVTLAVRDLTHVERLFPGSRVSLLQAPVQNDRLPNHIDPPSTFAQILHNTGFGDAALLHSRAAAWRTLYDLVRPRLLIADHSPTALLAARGYPFPCVTLGTGFSCPADGFPTPDWQPARRNDPARLRADETRVLETANHLLADWGEARLDRLTDLYRDVADTLLLTYRELDPFPGRGATAYLGIWPAVPAPPAVWPRGSAPRVFAYLRRFPALPDLLSLLSRSGLPTIVRSEGMDPDLRRRVLSPTLRLEEGMIDVDQAAAQCDVAIVNASHMMTASCLLAGKPLMLLPPFLEQVLTARRVVALGAGLIADLRDPARHRETLDRLIEDGGYARSAAVFAERYAGVDREAQLERAIQRLLRMVDEAR